MSQTQQEFYIGQRWTNAESYPPEAAEWANNNNAAIQADEQGFEMMAVPEPTPEELNKQRVIEIDAELAALDARSARSLRAIAAGTGNEYDTQAIMEIEAKAVELRAERNILQPAMQAFTL